jgi:hypothetical protein
MAGAIRGEWASLAQAPPEAFYVWGRAVTAITGTATVWVLYRAASRWGHRTALLAAVMFAVMPLHVRESHYVLTDVPATFFVILTLLLSLRAHERGTTWAFALAGMAAGLAAGTKYTGGVAIVMPLVACLMTPALQPSRGLGIVSVVAGAAGAFLAAAPYAFLDLPVFLNQFARLSGEYRLTPPLAPPLETYLKHLRNAYEWPGSVIVVCGLVVALFRTIAGPDRLKWTLAALFPILYFRFISNQNIVFARYLLPLLPFLSLLGAAAIVTTLDRLRGLRLPLSVRRAVVVALTMIAVLPPAYVSMKFDANAARPWTTELAYNWILRSIPAGSKVTMESRQILLPVAYKAQYLSQLRLHPYEHYAGEGVEYLVASSQCYGPYLDSGSGGPQRFPTEYAEYMRIFTLAEEVARFTPSTEHPGPELRILRIKRMTP